MTNTYDAMGRMLTTSVGGSTVQSVTYDALGRTATRTDARGITVSYTYDALGRMASVTTPAVPNETFTYTYLGASSQVAGITMPGSVTTVKSYDALGRLDTVTNSVSGQASASTVSSFDYTYDSHDRRVSADLADGGKWDYSYDAAGQLTGGTRTAPGLDSQPDTVVHYGCECDSMENRALPTAAARDRRSDRREWPQRP